jgi:hypothetical protein
MMNLRSKLATAVGAVALVAAAAYAPTASADRVGFNLSIGGPGYAFSAGNYGYGYYDYYNPAPVVVAPYVPYYGPRYYAAPVVVDPYPVYRPYRHYYRDGHRHYNRHDRHHNRHDRRGHRH